jgi:1,4-dihydroxy-2-naphthoyl-CoA hydrolase
MLDIAAVQKLLDPLFPGLLGLRLAVAGNDRVVAEMPVRPELCTTGGVLHGGALMALADTLGAVGTFMNLGPGQTTTTTDSSTKFIAPARHGTTVTAECLPFHRGRRTMVWQTVVRNEEGKVCAVVTQTQLVLGAPD